MAENIWLIIHLIGVAIGAGSVTVAWARETYFRVRPQEIEKKGKIVVIPLLLHTAFALTLISGFFLYLESTSFYNQSLIFQIKVMFFALLLLNHISINLFLRARAGSMRRLYMLSEYFSLAGWYFLIALSVFI